MLALEDKWKEGKREGWTGGRKKGERDVGSAQERKGHEVASDVLLSSHLSQVHFFPLHT